MKIKNWFCFVVLVSVAAGCKNADKPAAPPHSYLHALVDSLLLNKNKNIIIYSINPNDCINCLYGFSMINEKLTATSNSKIYVLPVEREIEKNELIRSTQNISLKDSVNKVVLWDKKLFTKISASTKNELPVSLLSIYSYQLDSIVFSKPVKSIPTTTEFESFLNK